MTLVTRREAEDLLGYAPGSLRVVMRQQRGRWPDPVACQLGDRALLWELDTLRPAAAGHARARPRRPAAADEDGLVTCLSCGRRLRSLGPHLARIHGVTAAQYRAEHRLPATSALMGTATRQALSAARTSAMAEDPELLARMRAATPPLEVLAPRSAAARAGTDDLPQVRTARRRGWDASVLRAMLARARQRHRRARELGYRSWRDAITSTRGMPARRAAELLGVGRTTVQRWRQRYRSPHD